VRGATVDNQSWVEWAESYVRYLETAKIDINIWLEAELGAQKGVDELQHKKELWEAAYLLSETNKEGAINGSNEQKRKLQAFVFLEQQRNTQEAYGSWCDALETAEEELASIKLNVKKAINQFSATKQQARLVEAVLRSLAG